MDRNDDLGTDALRGTGNAAGSGMGTGGAGTGGAEGDDFGVYDVHYYRGHFDNHPARPETHTYEQARTGYQAGHVAAAAPAYQGRTFTDVEVDLQQNYRGTETTRWENVREYARHGFEWKRVLGGIALAAGGWWAGKQLVEALRSHNNEDEKHYRAHFESHPARTTGMTYDRARTGYVLGYTAARNPAYAGRSSSDVETDLRSGFSGSNAADYDQLRDFCECGYNRGLSTSGRTGGLGDGSPGL
ncbi:MAG TPA: hypothetical protein VF665_12215, partial [Longimicrobium sp.]|uniref:hypothetical protein n=1 Tax=Longimicrobium sp. TaxID=2029185 RepID=UPI002ED9EDBA